MKILNIEIKYKKFKNPNIRKKSKVPKQNRDFKKASPLKLVKL